MNLSTGIIYATEREAGPFLQAVSATRQRTGSVSCWSAEIRNRQIHIMTSEMGSDNARKACSLMLAEFAPEWIVNPGICGALKDCFRPGDILTSSSVHDGDAGPRSQCYAVDPLDQLPSASIATVLEPVFNDERRAELAALYDLVDMESFAIAETCANATVTLSMLKGVSDMAGSGSRKDLSDNIDSVSKNIADHLMTVLNSNFSNAE